MCGLASNEKGKSCSNPMEMYSREDIVSSFTKETISLTEESAEVPSPPTLKKPQQLSSATGLNCGEILCCWMFFALLHCQTFSAGRKGS